MRNLLTTPHKAARMLVARLPFTTTLSCESVAPLLMPFSENALDAKTHTRIAHHVDGCPHCQAEVQMLGEMADFFRANPPQTAAPAPNLWQSIESQIQAETPERIAAFNASPHTTPAPVRGRFDWSSFGRSFAATGGVMTAVVACVWLFAAQHPLEKPQPSPASPVAAASVNDVTTIQLLPKRVETGSAKPLSRVATRAGLAPVLRMKSSTVSVATQKSLPLLGKRRIADVSLGDRTLIVRRPATLGFAVLQSPQAARFNVPPVDIANRTVASKPAASLLQADASIAKAIVRRDATSETPEMAQTSADMSGGDALPIVRGMLDSALEKATVVAVAASLSAQRQGGNNPALAALPDMSQEHYAGATARADDGVFMSRNHDADMARTAEAPAPPSRRMGRRTQVAWLVEDGTRSERSTVDATRTERRQQSLFSYGSR